MDDIDKAVANAVPWPYDWIICRNAEGRRTFMCSRCSRIKRVPLVVEQSDIEFARLAADYIIRHKGCVQRPHLRVVH